MPSAGLQIFSAGLRLQPVTPGLTDQGNFHISGVGLAEGNIAAYGFKSNGMLLCYGKQNTTTQNANWRTARNIVIGENNDFVNSSGFLENIFIVSDSYISKASDAAISNAVCIGQSVSFFGTGKSANIAGGILIGANTSCSINSASAQANNDGPIVIGYFSEDLNSYRNVAATGNLILGNNVTLQSCSRVIVIGSQYPDPSTITGKTNYIKIGNSSQTEVNLGPYLITTDIVGKYCSKIDNTTVANTTAETSIIGTVSGTLTVPANRLKVGSTLRITARGTITDTGTPTIRLKIKLGSTTFLDFSAVTLPSMTGTHGWLLEGEIAVRTDGAGGTAIGNGTCWISVAGAPDIDTTNTTTTALDTTAAQTLDITAQWGTASPSNAITCTHMTMELIG